MAPVHSVMAGQSRKSPSGTRSADTIARSGKASCLRTSLPANTRCSRARVAARTSATSTGSCSGVGGSPTGPLENSHTGRVARASPQRGHQLPGRLQPVAGVDGAAQHHRVVAVDAVDLLGLEHRRVQPPLAERVPDHLGDLAGRAVPGRRRNKDLHHVLWPPRTARSARSGPAGRRPPARAAHPDRRARRARPPEWSGRPRRWPPWPRPCPPAGHPHRPAPGSPARRRPTRSTTAGRAGASPAPRRGRCARGPCTVTCVAANT
jgi:hypothetical protein